MAVLVSDVCPVNYHDFDATNYGSTCKRAFFCLQDFEQLCVSPKTPLLQTRVSDNAWVCGVSPRADTQMLLLSCTAVERRRGVLRCVHAGNL